MLILAITDQSKQTKSIFYQKAFWVSSVPDIYANADPNVNQDNKVLEGFF